MHFSVVICTYNYAQFIPDTLRSVAAQKKQDFELLVVDDGSTDNTEEVVRGFSGRFRNLVYLKKAHTGLADSRNYGVQAASGTHIAFLDADDLWSPDCLNTFEAAFGDDPKAEFVCCDGYTFRSNGALVGPFFPPRLPCVRGPIRTSRELFTFFPFVGAASGAFPRSVFARVGPYDPRFSGYGDDRHWVIRAVQMGIYCVRVDQKLLLHRAHGGSLTFQSHRGLDPWITIYTETLKDHPLDSETERVARNYTRDFVLRLLGLCPAERRRALLARALEGFPGDPVLRTAYMATYFGLGPLLKCARVGKTLARRILTERHRIDLKAPPEVIFQSLPS